MLNHWRRPEARYARRMARIARWDKPLTGRRERLDAWANMLLSDHGIFRLAYLNAHRIAPGFWRSAQPSPGDIAWFARAGVKTVVNLRGGREHGAWPLEREACDTHGLILTDVVIRSREAPERETLLALPELFASLSYPVLVHCKSGADRAGMFAALYLLIHEKRPLAEAMEQLSLRYGHFRFAKTGILDAFLAQYARDGDARGMAFLDWVEREYDPARLTAEFRPSFWSDLVVDRIIHRE